MTNEFCDVGGTVSDVEELNEMARSLERSEARRVGANIIQARKNIARRLGITADTIENFRSLRNKIVPNRLMNRFRAELVSALQLEMQNLEHEIQLHRRAGSHHSNAALACAEAALVEARQLLQA